jgi:HPt (histidine-containing phosphotransfer) domain-containing protein
VKFEDLLKNLQRDYLASLPDKISNIQRLAHAADNGGLREAFHKLKGTGRTYGVPEVSELAEVVEVICVQRPEQAVAAASHASALLEDIHSYRSQERVFELATDPRFEVVRALLKH